MCFYQPNPPGCICAFHQLIQPCQNVIYYSAPNPSKNPNPLVRVCGAKQFMKGVGIRICHLCQSMYPGMTGIGRGSGIGMGMGMGMGYNVNLGMGFTGFISSGPPGSMAPGVQEQGQGQRHNLKTEVEERAALEKLANDAMMAAYTSTTPTPTFMPTSPTASDPGFRSDSNLMVRRRGPKTELRRLLPYPSPTSKRRMAVSSPVPGSPIKSASAEGPIPSPTPSPTEIKIQGEKGEGQVSGNGRVLGELDMDGDETEARVLLLQCQTALEEKVRSPASGVEGEASDEKTTTTETEGADGKDNTVDGPEKGENTHGVQTTTTETEVADGENDTMADPEKQENAHCFHKPEQTHGLQAENESGTRIGSRHGSMDDRVERLVMA
ncbi:uncharacterized protein DSM5745_03524 [Aspergillus mulundensis]|uniref:Uncharacterized protein n=1 Tax=Aspergillus mulundensis TaxID=1810919 RepID=A0A3D8SKV4_9EURO|nr:hypothetical protein DSM5745_03524 [Aspergillus mulundensis]RDW86882.1 hypothetical protein DSM5745_03524 [Aspergillus mulundensis]